MHEIVKHIQNGFLIFDGAMGTMLQKKGLSTGKLPETYNIDHPEVVTEIHQSYVKAGAQVVVSNTFQANAYKLNACNYSPEAIIEAGVCLAKKSGAQYVALDIGPIGQLMAPMGSLSFDEAYQLFKQQIVAGAKAGADVILIETMSDLYEAKVAVLAARENCNLPVFCTMTFEQDGRTFAGTDPLTAINMLNGLRVDAVGVNCSLGPDLLGPVIDVFLTYAKMPVMIKPNAGLPQIVDGKTSYSINAATFAQMMHDYARRGASIMGGCCGTTPETILALAQMLKNVPYQKRCAMPLTAVSSTTMCCVIDGVAVIGERINPTGKKKMQAALRVQSYDVLIAEAIAQSKAGADILDVNAGLPDIDEVAVLTKSIAQIQAITQLPLQIDSSNVDAVARAARYYRGKPIINSVNGKQQSMDAIFPIVQKYGALVVALTLDEHGIPETAQERVAIAARIIEEAARYGIPKSDILVDCLVLTASAQQQLVIETLKAVSLVKQKFGVKTVLGVSNVSFGLPNREQLNSVFLSAAFGAGLDLAIMNPLSDPMMDVVATYRVLNAQDKDAASYVARFGEQSKPAMQHEKSGQANLLDIVIEGRKEQCAATVQALLKTTAPLSIIENYFIPALDIVGERFGAGELFLPQLIQSAETVKRGFAILKELQQKGDPQKQTGKIILATVYGDVHDIGKNIVKLMLENYGFDVLDLGKDVPVDTVVSAAISNQAHLVGLSALMTTTVANMKDTITALRQAGFNKPVMVGGAVLSEAYAEFVGADYYASDARESVRIAKDVISLT